jgi:hypothetical protein
MPMACLAILINDTMHCYVARNSAYILEATYFKNVGGLNSVRRRQQGSI